MAKYEQNQEVKSLGLVSLIFVSVVGIFAWLPVWNSHSAMSQEHAMRRAESLAYQLLETQRVTSRGPASAAEVSLNQLAAKEGRIGVDPWGRPYNFKMMKLAENQKTKVFVWSLGPNGHSETSSEILDSNRDAENPTFDGDDVGIMVSIK